MSFVMNDATRLAYLDAMGIECWVAKADFVDAKSNPLSEINSVTVRSHSPLNQTANNRVIEANQTEQSITPEQLEKTEQSKTIDQQKAVVQEKVQAPAQDKQIAKIEKGNNQPQHFLKLVKWNNQVVKEEGCKELLIICRHEVDQPANSFAKGNSPSRFMTDYINAIVASNAANGFEISIKLAHLSQAGLGNDCINLQQFLQQSKLDMVLLLGDETLSQIVAEKVEVSSYRGRLVALANEQNGLVSYHPFTLIKNPALKSLALEDISGLVNFLAEGS